MCRVQSVRYLSRDLQYFFKVERTGGDPLAQSLSIEQFQHDETPSRVLADIEYGTGIRMIQGGRSPSLAFESFESGGVGGNVRRQQLQRDGSTESGVVGAINLTHPPFAQWRLDTIWPELQA